MNGNFWFPKPEILGLYLLWLLSSPGPFDTSHFLIRSKGYLRELYLTVTQRQKEIGFLSICHVDETRVCGAVLFNTHRPW